MADLSSHEGDRDLTALAVTGVALASIGFGALVIPGSIIEFRSIRHAFPLTIIYGTDTAHYVLIAAVAALIVVFVGAVVVAGRIASRDGVVLALAATALLAVVFAFVFPSGSVDIYHNIADARTLWLHGENPLRVPPSAHSGSEIVNSVFAWRNSTSSYGPLAYVVYGPSVLLAGDGVLGNLLAVKAFHVFLLLVLTWVVGKAAADLRPERRVQAMVLVGWNPFVLYEGVANAHNDLVMALLLVAGLALTVRKALGGPVLVIASAAVKYVTGLATPHALFWLWRIGSPGQRRVLAGVVALGPVFLLAILAVAFEDVKDQKNFALPSGGFHSPITVLVDTFENLQVGSRSAPIARILAWSLFGVVATATLLMLDRSARSLWTMSFWLMAAAAALGPTTFWSWYLLWFIPLGAVLAGSREADLAVAASAAGLLSYAIFPWISFSGLVNAAFVALVFASPVAYVLLADVLSLPTTRRREPRERQAAASA